ncbi:MAG: arsenite methyltransferase [Dehalococcoidia bacterium]|nr:arsenite methyltransferase [Dehalococcoidia bacterium]
MTDTPSAREIQRAVVDTYGARARAVLASAGAPPTADACCAPASAEDAAAGACCSPAASMTAASAAQPMSVSFQAAAASAPTADESCCGPDCCDGSAQAASEGNPAAGQQFGAALYEATDVSALPESVVAASAGCGNPLAIAALRPGERVLDLGSGGGIDCFLAARQVGEAGEVWGLDMTPDMVALARHNAGEVGLENVRFRLGEIEDIPFEEGRFDVIMSNCVINLSADKPRVFREAFRVLAAGGRLGVSDMVQVGELSEGQRASLDQWAGCIAGALPLEDYLDAIRAAGFVQVEAQHEATAPGVVSAYLTARKA